jgi:ADP-heptose:LPS heptosyltransferase
LRRDPLDLIVRECEMSLTRSPRIDARTITSVAVLRALKIGDLFCAIPALRAIRGALPQARIVLIGLPWARGFVQRFSHLVDGFREFPGWPGLPEIAPRIDRVPDFLHGIQQEQFDLAIQLHGSGAIVNQFIALLGARATAGFQPARSEWPKSDLFIPWPEQGLEIRRLLTLTDHLDFPAAGEHLEFPLNEADLAAGRELLDPDAGEYACIHPGASAAERRWPVERFAVVAQALAARGLRIVLTGAAEAQSLTRSVAAALAAPAIDLAGKTDLGATAAIVSGARLIVCNDTGVSHIAAAVGTPSVVISTGCNPSRWAPLDTARHWVLSVPGGWPEATEVVVRSFDLLGSLDPVSNAQSCGRDSRSTRSRFGERASSFTGLPGCSAHAWTRQPV